MRLLIKCLIILLLLGAFEIEMNAQQVNTLYFMDNAPERNYLNPAFQATTQYYLSLPVIGFTGFSIGNNSLTLKDVVYKHNGQAITFLNPNGNVNRFYNTLQPNTVIRADLQTTLLSFGFKHNQTYWNFSLSEKFDAMASIPKDIFRFLLYGTPSLTNNTYNATTLQADMTAYTEAAIGFSKKLDDKFTLGAKLKFLYGNANVSNTNKQISLDASIDKWVIKEGGVANVSSPMQFLVDKNYQTVSVISPTNLSNWLKPSGVGAGLDFGVEYRLNDHFSLSGAVTDVGFISWYRNAQNFNYATDFTFDGVAQLNPTNTNYQNIYTKLTSGNYVLDSLQTAFQSASTLKKSYHNYYTAITSKLNLGLEYTVLDNKLSFGLLSRSQFFKQTITEELTSSVNFKPDEWINASLSYSFFGGRMSSVGAGVGIRTGFIHWLVAADYIPFQLATLSSADFGGNYPYTTIKVPYNIEDFNLSVGMTIVFDSFKHKPKNGNSSISDQTDEINNASGIQKPMYYHSRTYNSKGLYKKPSGNDCNCDPN